MRCYEEPILIVAGTCINLWCAACDFEQVLGYEVQVMDAAEARIRHTVREVLEPDPHPALVQLQEKLELPNRPVEEKTEHKSEYRWI